MPQNTEIQRLSERYEEYVRDQAQVGEDESEKIHVDEIASKVAAFYEKVRNVIEYRDAHLLRKNAIERTLRRHLFLKDFTEHFAEPLIKELIRAGHLSNDTVPETKIADIQGIIDNLLALLRLEEHGHDKEKNETVDWIVRMFASRIEEELFPAPEVALLSEAMYGVIKENLTLKNIPLSKDDANIQLFVATQRALWRPDANQLKYLLLRIMYPDWGMFPKEELPEVAANLEQTRTAIEKILANPYAPAFFKLCNREKIIFQLIGDLVFEGVDFADEKNLSSALKFRYEKRYFRAKGQMRRLAFLSVASFLISKLLVAFAIEIPLDRYFYHGVSGLSLLVNIAFPPLLMLFIVAGTKLPSTSNFALVESAVDQVLFSEEGRNYVVAAPKKKGPFANFFVYLAYAAVLLAIIYYVAKVLLWLQFSPASIVIFLLFTSMVTATGVKVKNRAREMSMEREKTSVTGFVVDLITVPFMTIGRWTIAGISRFNIVVIAFDFLIELPFQFFVEFLENFRSFIRARKDEIN
jgi:hypothetical protein